MTEQVKKAKAVKYNLIHLMIAFITAGGINALLTYYTAGTNRDDNYIEKYVNEVEKCNEEINALSRRLMILESSQASIPFPYWVKDVTGNIEYVNDEYEDAILIPLGYSRRDVIGTKGDSLGSEFVAEMIENDRRVLTERRVLRFAEVVPSLGKGISYKFPIVSPYGQPKGSGGIWIQEDRYK